MATRAQRNQVRKGVRLAISLQAEHPKRNDVMHVQRVSQAHLRNAAELTLMTVSSSRIARLTRPVGAVVFRVTSAPCGVVFCAPVRGAPGAEADSVAEVLHPVGRPPLGSLERLRAMRAPGLRQSFEPRRSTANESSNEGCAHTLSGAVRLSAPSIRWRSVERRLAVRAPDRLAASKRGEVLRQPKTGFHLRSVALLVGLRGLWAHRHSISLTPLDVTATAIGGEGYA